MIASGVLAKTRASPGWTSRITVRVGGATAVKGITRASVGPSGFGLKTAYKQPKRTTASNR